VPLRRPPGPVILETPYLHRQTSQQSDINSSSTNPTNTAGRGGGGGGGGGGGRNNSEPHVDIRALAQEVAAVLYQNPSHHKDYNSQDLRGGQMAVQNRNDDEMTDYARSSQITHHPPPNYRAATGPSDPSSVGSQGKT